MISDKVIKIIKQIKPLNPAYKVDILRVLAYELSKDEKFLKYLWEHTYSEDQYYTIRGILEDLKDMHLCMWIEENGEIKPLELP